MKVMKSALVSAVLLCAACLLIDDTLASKHHNKHHELRHKIVHHNTHNAHRSHSKPGHNVVHHNTHRAHRSHPKPGHNVVHHSTHHTGSKKHHVIKHAHDKLKKNTVPNLNHHYKKSTIPDHDLAKKFDIQAHPQKRPDMMTVVMKGIDGPIGIPGQKGDVGSPGAPGVPGLMGDKGAPGVCSRAQCENEQLKSLIQRLLALEKFVNSYLKNKKNTTNNSGGNSGGNSSKPVTKNASCTNITTVKSPGFPCPPNLFAIVPLFQLAKPKPAQNAPQGKEPNQGQTPSQVQAPNKGQAPNQGQTSSGVINPPGPTPTSAALNKPTGTAPPTGSSLQRPAVTPPPPPFFITLQGVTTYDNPMAVMPQQRSVPYIRQYKTLPANWATSGAGPIDLKPALYRRTYSRSPAQQTFYSPGWTTYKRNKIPHGLLTHKLASKMLHSKSKLQPSNDKTHKTREHKKSNKRFHVKKENKKTA